MEMPWQRCLSCTECNVLWKCLPPEPRAASLNRISGESSPKCYTLRGVQKQAGISVLAALTEEWPASMGSLASWEENKRCSILHPSIFLISPQTKCVSCDLHIHRYLKHGVFSFKVCCRDCSDFFNLKPESHNNSMAERVFPPKEEQWWGAI